MTDVIVRSAPFELTRAAENGDGLTFEGYAALFDTPTTINSRIEAFDLGLDSSTFQEQIARSAFSRSIGNRAQWPLINFEHGRHPMIGSMPIGVVTELKADSKGLFVRARLTDSWLIEPVRAAVRDRAVTGMSFRAEALKETIDRGRKPPLVSRTELKLIDLGPVTRAQYEGTTATVRSKEIADALRDPEARLDLVRALLGPDDDCGCGEAEFERAVTGSTGLPVASRDRTWDADAAKDRVFAAATGEGGRVNTRQVSRAFLWRDPDADPQTQAAYKLGFADIVNGELTIIPRGVAATTGGRGVGAADIPEADKARIRQRICILYDRVRRTHSDWPECPFERSAPDPDDVSLDIDTSNDHDGSGTSSGPGVGDPPDGHSPVMDRDDPPDGHSSMSVGHVRAELARINGLIDIAERSAL